MGNQSWGYRKETHTRPLLSPTEDHVSRKNTFRIMGKTFSHDTVGGQTLKLFCHCSKRPVHVRMSSKCQAQMKLTSAKLLDSFGD